MKKKTFGTLLEFSYLLGISEGYEWYQLNPKLRTFSSLQGPVIESLVETWLPRRGDWHLEAQVSWYWLLEDCLSPIPQTNIWERTPLDFISPRVPNFFHNHELSLTISWVGCSLTDAVLPDIWMLRKWELQKIWKGFGYFR